MYPKATAEQIAAFDKHGWLIVRDAIPTDALDEIERRCDELIERKSEVAYDWAWKEGEAREERSFRIVQSKPEFVWPEIAEQPFRRWMAAFASALMHQDIEFWYNQFLAKPPSKSAPTYWHQDEGYWGRNLENRGITCWMPLQDVNAENGCMHFIDGGHKRGILEHRQVEGVQSDLLTCSGEGDVVVCPIRRGDVTFHHSAMPHMATENTSKGWRKAIANHMQAVGAGGEGNHYAWKISVNQFTGERSSGAARPAG